MIFLFYYYNLAIYCVEKVIKFKICKVFLLNLSVCHHTLNNLNFAFIEVKRGQQLPAFEILKNRILSVTIMIKINTF